MQPHKLARARRAKKGLAWHLSAKQSIPIRSCINRRPRPPGRIYIFAGRRIIYPGRDYFVAVACEQKGDARSGVGRQVGGNLRKLFAIKQPVLRRRLNRRIYRGKRRLKYTGKFCCGALRSKGAEGIYGAE